MSSRTTGATRAAPLWVLDALLLVAVLGAGMVLSVLIILI